MPDRQRTALLGQVLTDDTSPLRSRVAAVILMLYAQPLSRITQLTIDDVVREGDQVLLRLDDPPSPAPEPVAALLLEYLGQRSNMATATNRESRWLFPGRRAGQPLRSDTLSALVHALGVPATPDAPPRSASTSSACPPRSSPPRSAITRSLPPASPPKPARPGPATPRGRQGVSRASARTPSRHGIKQLQLSRSWALAGEEVPGPFELLVADPECSWRKKRVPSAQTVDQLLLRWLE